MADKPILFSGPMVRALVAGTKTQTRRVVKPQPELQGNGHYHVFNAGGGVLNVEETEVGKHAVDYLRIAVGDRLYVREAWSGIHAFRNTPPAQRESMMTPDGPLLREDVWFWADGNPDGGDYEKPRPAMHMPRWASRLTLTVTDVRVERLQDINEKDALAEGVVMTGFAEVTDHFGVQVADDEWCVGPTARAAYNVLWTHINDKSDVLAGQTSWDKNPWVAAYTFTIENGNIDKLASVE